MEHNDENADNISEWEEAFKIMLTCSRRFNGYIMMENPDYRPFDVIHSMLDGNCPRLTLVEKMAAFHFIERGWFNDGGLHPWVEWDLYKSLFFELCEEEVPHRYQVEGYCKEWRDKYLPRIDELKEIVHRAELDTYPPKTDTH